MNGAFAWLAGLVAFIPGLGAPSAPQFTGYVEAQYVYVAPASTGIIAQFKVKEGQPVKAGDVLFVQTTAQQQALYNSARAQADAAVATWQNLLTGGRPEELAASQAAVKKAQADVDLAEATFARSQKLFASNTITQAQLDQDTAAVQSAQASLNQAKAQAAVTALPGRQAQQAAAKAQADAAQAEAANAKATLDDRTITAPVDGRIERTYYEAGEMVQAGATALSILPAKALKVEFYVAEPDRIKLTLGTPVEVACDGCGAGLAAKVSFLASDAQYTSPLIYSRDERATLVYLAEATIADPGNILPGQPVTVRVGHD
jgi:HlyD family secretion protein